MSVLKLENVTKAFDGIQAIDKVTLEFNKGKITALIGPNGAGKTTVFNLITGLIQPDTGTIHYQNNSIIGFSLWHITSLGIGRLFQDVHIFSRMTVKENILAAFKNQSGESVWRTIITPWRIRQEEKSINNKATKLLEYVGLIGKQNEIAETLSYGQQKLLAIARLLAMDVDVLLLDEPTSGVAPAMVDTLLNLIRRLSQEGKTIIIIEHNMDVVTKVADWAFFMDEGRVVSYGLPNDLLNSLQVRTAYMGF